MPRLVASQKIGLPAPTSPDTEAVRIYFGKKGFEPSYESAEFVYQRLNRLNRIERDGVEYVVVDTEVLPPMAEGDYDFYFTYIDDVGNESDFSPVITIPLDRHPPAAPGQPIVLD